MAHAACTNARTADVPPVAPDSGCAILFFTYLCLSRRRDVSAAATGTMPHFTDSLNPAQREAVLNYDKPSLIVAGAGSGKTRVLTSRIAYMIEQGVPPGSILALTFTNKAAREMRERIQQIVPDGRARYIWMGTFHSVFYRILRQEAARLGFGSNFTIYDTSNSESLLSTIIKERNLDTETYKPRDIHTRISLAKNNLVTAESYCANASFAAEDRQRKRPEFGAIFLEYARRCKANNAMDFDDLLIYTNILFRDFPDALATYREKFRYILVDEYQDTNYAQYLIVRRLAETHSNVCVVGDDAQSIYSFRGAKIENILRFQNDFPTARVFKLEQNYRSTQNIVNAANSIIARNDRQIPKKVFSENDEGDKIKVIKTMTDREEAIVVAETIRAEGRASGGRWSEIAVLYRNNSQSRAIEDALRRRDVPYKIYSGHSFYDRKEIKDLVAYFRLIVNPRDNEALRRIINTPARGIGAVTVNRLTSIAEERGTSIWEVLERLDAEEAPELRTARRKLLDFAGMIRELSLERTQKPLYEFGLDVATRSGIIGSYRLDPSPESESALENIGELLSSMENFKQDRIVLAYEEGEPEDDAEPTVEEWLQNISLMTDMDKDGADNTERVMLMTVHSAKGLEFDTVFIVGVEENLFPSLMSATSQEKLEEERRLFYVAVTRARKKAFVTFAQQRFKWGNMEFCNPSRFISEMDPRYVDLPDDMDEDGASPLLERYRTLAPQAGGKTGTATGSSRGNGYGHSPTDRNGGYGSPAYGARTREAQPVRTEKPAPAAPRGPLRSVGTRRAAEEAPAATGSSAAGIYTVGQRVEHARFGCGRITAVEDMASDVKLTVEFDDGAVGRKSLLSKYAKLRIL